MKNPIRRIPYAMGGLALATVCLGYLIGATGERAFSLGLKVFGAVMIAIVLIKILLNPKKFLGVLQQPASGGALAAIPLTVVLISVDWVVWNAEAARILWWIGIGLYLLFMLIFTLRMLRSFDVEKLFPGHLLMYSGPALCAGTARSVGSDWLGPWMFYFGALASAVLLPIMLYRFIVLKNIPVSEQPTLTLFVVPSSVLLFSYLLLFSPQAWITTLLAIVTGLMLLFVMLFTPKLLRRSFVPSFAILPFSFTMVAVAFQRMFLESGLILASQVLIGMAILFYLYVLFLYTIAIVKGDTIEIKKAA